MAHETRCLAEAMASARFDDLPAPVIEEARRAILDWLGSAMAGSIEAPARMAQRVIAGFGASDEATVFSAARSSAVGAALSNGVSSHILEFDDVHKGSTLHPAAAVIPAALAVSEREHSDGRAFLLAVVAGYDAALRVGEAVNPSHYRFWHPTGTAATFGAAAAAASILKLDAAKLLDALGTAGTQAAGLWEFNADGAMSKHLHPGKAAFNGIIAADLAREGFTGAKKILEGERGFFRAMSESFDASRITDGLGSHWKILENCYKLHSCCGHTHTAIDVALDLRREHIESVLIETYAPGFEIVKEMNPRTPYQAKFSIAYCVSAALTEGVVGLEQFSEDRVEYPPALLRKTTVRVDPALTAKYPAAWPARVTITLDDGNVLRGESDFPRGNPENPVSTEELKKKFRALVGPRFGCSAADRAIAVIDRIESCGDVAGLFRDLI